MKSMDNFDVACVSCGNLCAWLVETGLDLMMLARRLSRRPEFNSARVPNVLVSGMQ